MKWDYNYSIQFNHPAEYPRRGDFFMVAVCVVSADIIFYARLRSG